MFDSRKREHKWPFGAVPAGRLMRFAICPGREKGVRRAQLCLRRDGEEQVRRIPLRWEKCCLTREWYAAALRAPEPGLYWYHLLVWGVDGCTRLGRGQGGCATDDPAAPDFQLTVYDGHARVADWLGRGVVYQIFPDRFARRGAAPALPGRVVHPSWEDLPVYQPNDRGEIENNDFFGGNLAGITDRLDYLASLSVTTLYLNPIFAAASNHRYDTGDYERIDPMLGTEREWEELCRQAGRRGIRVVIDGVFSHTGKRSRYFSGPDGAATRRDSPYAAWYTFSHWPDRYESWWGIDTLPQVREMEPSYLRYIVTGRDSIVRRWLRAGAAGWRLDVADELPDAFIRRLRRAAREEKADALILGEVWEDASNKIAYGQRRAYLLGQELDSVMNYPFRQAALAYLRGGDARQFYEQMETLRENYPAPVFYNLMNLLSTHDTPRLITALAAPDGNAMTREQRAHYRLDSVRRSRGLRLVRLAAALQFCFPGAPSVYYGDEVGMEGYEDPFNRGTFPLDGGDGALAGWYRRLGGLRRRHAALREGEITWLHARGPVLAFWRGREPGRLAAVFNRAAETAALPWPLAGNGAWDLFTGRRVAPDAAGFLQIPGENGMLLSERVGE